MRGAALVLFSLVAQPLPAEAPAANGPVIELAGEKLGPPQVTVGCDRYPVYLLLREIAERTGLDYRDEGEPRESGARAEGPRVTVDLVRRPVGEVVEIVAGAAGRSAVIDRGTILLFDESANDPSGSFPRLRDRAIESYQRALVRHAAHPRTRRAHIEIGKLRETDGDLPGAAAEFASFVAEYPDDPFAPEARFRYARALSALGREDESRAQLLTLAEFHPSHPLAVEATLELALSFESAGNEFRAHAMLRDVACGGRASRPLAEKALQRWVRLLLDDGDSAGALEALGEGAEALGPDAEAAPYFVVLRAEALLLGSRSDEAIDALARVPDKAAESSRARLLLGRALRKKGDPLAAIAALKGAARSARDAAESAAATIELGQAYEDASLSEKVQSLYTAELEAMKGHRFARNEIRFALATSLVRSGEVERARQIFSEMKREATFEDRAALFEARCYLAQEDPVRARDALAPLLERETLAGVERRDVAELLARALSARGGAPAPRPDAGEGDGK